MIAYGAVDDVSDSSEAVQDLGVAGQVPEAVLEVAARAAPVVADVPRESPGAYVLPAATVSAPDESAARSAATDVPWAMAVRQLAEPHGATSGYGLFARVALGIVGIVLAVRLVYDELLPRILAVMALAATVLLGLAMTLRAVAEARRQRSLLVALAHLTRMCAADAGMRLLLAPQIDAVVTALRAEPRVWPWSHEGSVTSGPVPPAPVRSPG